MDSVKEQTAENLEALDPQDIELEALQADETESPAAEETAQDKASAKIWELEKALEAAQAKTEEYLNMAQRVQADFDNFRRRNQNVRKEAFDEGASAFAATLLPVLDNFERAIDAAKDSADPALKEGVEMVYRQLGQTFETRGITPINRVGEKFDPNLENAVLQGSPEDGEPGTVCEVFQKGYQMGPSILRHAMVKVVPE